MQATFVTVKHTDEVAIHEKYVDSLSTHQIRLLFQLLRHYFASLPLSLAPYQGGRHLSSVRRPSVQRERL